MTSFQDPNVFAAYTSALDEKTRQFMEEATSHSQGQFPTQWMQTFIRRLAAKDLELQDRERYLMEYSHQMMSNSQQQQTSRNYGRTDYERHSPRRSPRPYDRPPRPRPHYSDQRQGDRSRPSDQQYASHRGDRTNSGYRPRRPRQFGNRTYRGRDSNHSDPPKTDEQRKSEVEKTDVEKSSESFVQSPQFVPQETPLEDGEC